MDPFLLTLETPRLRIRPLRPTDLADFHAYRADPAVTRYQGFDVFSREQAAAFIAQQLPLEFGQPGQWVQYGIESQRTGRLIGDCAVQLQQRDARMAEIGITIAPAAQRQGYAREVLQALLNFLFNLPDFHRVVETVDAENAASIALLESLGFRLEGEFRDNIFFKGQWGSERQYAMLRREWEA
ncbi:GNAT family N-acetyltransferase [Hymenobacter psychrophilus]|uniref:Protein N-acetyltransferase, RimJ/RimL family n=1 Tax=Hymenobacter psychrophilus TaxID=651662 RepID=A0A1H3DLY5_9BACT|nr:GNAT family protein [Hymenobacter psychrophilus]SDX66674.1 Protein N-acetyltransferase, RimJ/RimL family [Hymenobacter psychrophilus]